MTWPNDEFLVEDFTMIRVWVESSGSQSAVLFGKSTVFPKLIRTWFEQDSKKGGEKGVWMSVFFGANKRGWCLVKQQLRCNYPAFILRLSRRIVVRMWQIKKSHRSRTIDFTSTAYSLIVIRLKIRNFNLLQI